MWVSSCAHTVCMCVVCALVYVHASTGCNVEECVAYLKSCPLEFRQSTSICSVNIYCLIFTLQGQVKTLMASAQDLLAKDNVEEGMLQSHVPNWQHPVWMPSNVKSLLIFSFMIGSVPESWMFSFAVIPSLGKRLMRHISHLNVQECAFDSDRIRKMYPLHVWPDTRVLRFSLLSDSNYQ